MNKTVEYILKLVDKVTQPVQKAAGSVDKAMRWMQTSTENTRRKVGHLDMSMNDLAKRIESLKKTKGSLINLEDIRKTNGEIRKLELQLKKLDNMPPRGFFNNLTSVGSTIRGFVLPALLALTAQVGVGQVIDATKEFESVGARFATTWGSQAGGQLAMVQKMATETPFEFGEIANAVVKMTNRGFKVGEKDIKQYSDLAVGLGGTFEQVSEAILDIPLGQTRRLEELGIAANAIKGTNKLALSYKGLNLEVEKTPQAVQKAMEIMSMQKGIKGGSEAQMQTLGGKVSNLGDTFKWALVNIGEAARPLIVKVIDGLTHVLEKMTSFATWVMQNQNMIVGFFKVAAWGVMGLAAAYAYAEGKTILLAAKTMLLNSAFLMNPVTWVVAIIIALAGVFVYAWNKSEKFRGFILGLWEAFKTVGNNILNIFMPIISNLTNAFKALTEGRWADAARYAGKALAQGAIMPAKILYNVASGEVFKGADAAYKLGHAKGVGGFRAQKSRENRGVLDRLTDPMNNGLFDFAGDKKEKLNGDPTTGSGGADGAKSPKITTINFGPMSFNIKAIAKGGDMASLQELANEVAGHIAAGMYDVDVQFDA